jgi:ABC-2 type transport system ATP-binding protein
VVAVRGCPAGVAGSRWAGAALKAISAKGLTKRYGEFIAVDQLDLSVDQGELYGFLGPNGSGKTTTIRMALGLIFPSGGTVEVLGERVSGGVAGTSPALHRAGAIIEEPAFWRYLSGRRNLEYLARAAGSAAERRSRLSRIDSTLGLVGLEEAGRKRVSAYSQGMRQRLGIAASLLGGPDLLVLDEPTNGLDPQGMREIRLLLRRLADGGTTVFVSSHLLWEVEAMCDRVGVLARGRLLAEGPPSALRSPARHFRIEVDDRHLAERVLGSLDGVVLESANGETAGSIRIRLDPPATAAGVNERLVSQSVAVSALVPEQDSLEDVFLHLVEDAEGRRAAGEEVTRVPG